jgi:hypothetical protein
MCGLCNVHHVKTAPHVEPEVNCLLCVAGHGVWCVVAQAEFAEEWMETLQFVFEEIGSGEAFDQPFAVVEDLVAYWL